MITNISEFMWRQTPEYLQAYQEGYEHAKLEMLEALKNMKAPSSNSQTICVEEMKDD